MLDHGGVVPVVGAPNAYAALLAERAGLPLLYLSGSTLSASSFGLPDLGLTTLDEVVEDARRITRVSKLPLLVDADTGFGGVLNVARTIQELERVGAAGVHIEDQETQHKRCGHRPNKRVVATGEMVDRLQAAVAARRDRSFVIMARTDAAASEGLDAALKRAQAYIDAGADMLFPEALTHIDHYKAFTSAFPDTPVLANLTEFGRTPLFTLEELSQAKVSLALFPVSAFRAAARATQHVYETIAKDGSQSAAIPLMQTREELYDVLGYDEYEKALDALYPPPPATPAAQAPAAAAPAAVSSGGLGAEGQSGEEAKAKEEKNEEEEDAEKEVEGEVLLVEENGEKKKEEKVVGETAAAPNNEDEKREKEKEGKQEDEESEGEDEDDDTGVVITADSAAAIEEELASGKEIKLKD